MRRMSSLSAVLGMLCFCSSASAQTFRFPTPEEAKELVAPFGEFQASQIKRDGTVLEANNGKTRLVMYTARPTPQAKPISFHTCVEKTKRIPLPFNRVLVGQSSYHLEGDKRMHSKFGLKIEQAKPDDPKFNLGQAIRNALPWLRPK